MRTETLLENKTKHEKLEKESLKQNIVEILNKKER
jgi:hypothetical protein